MLNGRVPENSAKGPNEPPVDGLKLHFQAFIFLHSAEKLMKNNKKSPSAKSPPFKQIEASEEHSYATPMEVTNASSHKQDKEARMPVHTSEKNHQDKKPKGTSAATSGTLLEAILNAIDENVWMTAWKKLVLRCSNIDQC